MKLEDHFVINVARTARTVGDKREYEHHLRIEMPVARTKKEALEIFAEVRGKYPAPEYTTELTRVSVRNSEVCPTA